MDDLPIAVQMTKRDLFLRYGEMTEAVDLLRIGPTLRRIDLEVIEIRAAAA
jgi:hypothetical protein